MKQKVKNELLALSATSVIIEGIFATFLVLVGAFIGFGLAHFMVEECEMLECQECPVGFASLDDMSFLVSELRDCKGN